MSAFVSFEDSVREIECYAVQNKECQFTLPKFNHKKNKGCNVTFWAVDREGNKSEDLSLSYIKGKYHGGEKERSPKLRYIEGWNLVSINDNNAVGMKAFVSFEDSVREIECYAVQNKECQFTLPKFGYEMNKQYKVDIWAEDIKDNKSEKLNLYYLEGVYSEDSFDLNK